MGDASDASSDAVRTYNEMTRFRESLQGMVSAKSSHKLGVVTWEISRDRNVHLIWQLIAIPADLIQKGVAEAAFRVEAETKSTRHSSPRTLVSRNKPATAISSAYGCGPIRRGQD